MGVYSVVKVGAAVVCVSMNPRLVYFVTFGWGGSRGTGSTVCRWLAASILTTKMLGEDMRGIIYFTENQETVRGVPI
jgi:hypothetical protein